MLKLLPRDGLALETMLNIKSCCQLWQKPKIKRKCSKIQLCVGVEVTPPKSKSLNSISYFLRRESCECFATSTFNSILTWPGLLAKWDSEHIWHEGFFSKRKGKMDSFSILIFTWDWTRARFPITIFDASPLLRIRCSNFELWDGSF